jgi:hypothetical protein
MALKATLAIRPPNARTACINPSPSAPNSNRAVANSGNVVENENPNTSTDAVRITSINSIRLSRISSNNSSRFWRMGRVAEISAIPAVRSRQKAAKATACIVASATKAAGVPSRSIAAPASSAPIN